MSSTSWCCLSRSSASSCHEDLEDALESDGRDDDREDDGHDAVCGCLPDVETDEGPFVEEVGEGLGAPGSLGEDGDRVEDLQDDDRPEEHPDLDVHPQVRQRDPGEGAPGPGPVDLRGLEDALVLALEAGQQD